VHLFGILLGHVVCKQGLLVDLAKIAVILDLQPPTSVQTVERNSGTYMILQEVHQGLCTDYHTYGEVVEKRNKVPVE
jgi:hypothetical protein